MGCGASSQSIDRRISSCFHEPDLVPLYVQENFLQIRPSNCCSDLERLICLGAASRFLSDGDLVLFASSIETILGARIVQ